MMAAGGSVEPFWAMYAVHKESTDVARLLGAMRIGNIRKATTEGAGAGADAEDPFAGDPPRHPV